MHGSTSQGQCVVLPTRHGICRVLDFHNSRSERLPWKEGVRVLMMGCFKVKLRLPTVANQSTDRMLTGRCRQEAMGVRVALLAWPSCSMTGRHAPNISSTTVSRLQRSTVERLKCLSEDGILCVGPACLAYWQSATSRSRNEESTRKWEWTLAPLCLLSPIAAQALVPITRARTLPTPTMACMDVLSTQVYRIASC